MLERGMNQKKIISASEKFKIIKSIITKYKLKNMISYLCNISGVSRSGYYKCFWNVTVQKRKSIKVRDLESRENILKAYNFKNRKKGARQIKMILSNVLFTILY